MSKVKWLFYAILFASNFLLLLSEGNPIRIETTRRSCKPKAGLDHMPDDLGCIDTIHETVMGTTFPR